MCGILGQVALNNKLSIDIDRFNNSLNMMEHRGPDGHGYVSDRRFVFGHRRLSIIDLSNNAKQPMVSEDEKVIITFKNCF